MHSILYFNHSSVAIKDVTAISKLSSPSLSLTYFEPRLREYSDFRDRFYPGMTPAHYMDFIYAK